jgi:LAS superfamily LD-carboxypeptidase LdcB
MASKQQSRFLAPRSDLRERVQALIPQTPQGRALLIGGGAFAAFMAIQFILRPTTGWTCTGSGQNCATRLPIPKLIFLKSVGNGQSLARGVANDFLRMQAAAKSDGVNLIPNSGFRSMAKQALLYAEYLARFKGPPQVACPGCSNHQAGDAVDIIIPPSGTAPDSPARLASREYQWLKANAARFGFFNALEAHRESWHWSRTGR